MTDELDPQTQEHIDDPADVTTDTDAVTCDGADVDGPILDESATAETPESENADEQNDDAPAQDDAPVQDDAPQAAGPIEVSSEEELDAVMDSMMDAVKAMKDAVADADIDAEEEEAAEAASTFVPGETPVADQGSTMPSFLQLEHPTIGADAVDPHAAGFSVVEGGTGNIAAPQAADVIHTDFEKGFIKADIVSYDDFVAAEGSMVKIKEEGKLRQEGRDYVMADGDIVEFKFNVSK